ncbi:TetR/AcrR family transcriptional regulator [Nocardia sp. NPDC049149]|uniref:TetR/AcrR family transcriptional regulator n=1 Tax=Nocardia sp. NPDC049149 TaxID=3364315 RepID=UPI00371D8A90
MARTKPAEQRRSELLDAAEQLLAQKGIAAVTVEDITQAAGVSKGTFYSYFRAREDVLGALRARYIETLLDAQNEAMSLLHPDDWAGRIETWLVAGIRTFLLDPAKHNTLFHLPHGSTGDDAGSEEVGFQHVEVLRSLLTAGRDAGGLRVVDPESTAVLLYGSIHHGADYLFHAADPALTERVIAEVRRWCRSFILPEL